jgi:secondary thiamine-phosphate synthase enzyme
MLFKRTITTKKRDEMIDITTEVQAIIEEANILTGAVLIYCPHTTAGITINENADPDVVHDVLMRLDEVFPWKHEKYLHMEGNSASHLKAITVGSSQYVIVENGRLLLGIWQGIYFCEFDGPRKRHYYVKIIQS